MPLDDDQKHKAKAYFDQTFKCVRCGKSEGYEVDLAHVILEPPKDGAGPKMLPVLMVACDECWNVQFYSAKVLDLPL